jgi:hypothetical protein
MSISDVEEQLMMLKRMTVTTGAIHEAQKLQLINYPRMSAKIKAVTTKVDVAKKTVYFECQAKTKVYKSGKFENELFENIVTWVRILLWDESRVVIKVNGKRELDSATM